MTVTVDNGTLTDYVVASDTVAAEEVQVVKLMLGGAGTNGGLLASGTPLPVSGPLTDAQLRATAVPVSNAVLSASGSITTQNLVPAGAATAGSAVEIALSGANTLTAQVTGTYTGALSLQGTIDGTTWVTLGGTGLQVLSTGAMAATIASAATGLFQSDVTGLVSARVSGLAAMTGTAVVTLRAVVGTSVVAIDTTVPVSGTVAVSSVTTAIVPGVAATNLGKAEDAVHASGDTGVAVFAVRTDVPATTSSNTGDYDALHTGAEGGLHVSLIPAARNGMLSVRVAAAATTNATSVKASAGTLHGVALFNNTAVKKYFKWHNAAAAPTVGTTAVVLTMIIPADGGLVLSDLGWEFTTGIAYSITAAVGDADTTAVAANDVHGVLLYK